jgi:hypothetical protein
MQDRNIDTSSFGQDLRPRDTALRCGVLSLVPENRLFHRSLSLSFSQDFLSVAYERGKQVADDATRAGLDLDCNGHAGQKLDGFAFDFHLCAVKYNACGVNQLMTIGFTCGARHAN